MSNGFLLRFLTVVALTCSGLLADVIEMKLVTAVDGSNMAAFPVNQPITIRWTYESTGTPGLVSGNDAFYANQLRSLRITSGAYDGFVTGNFGQINKYDNLSNSDGITFKASTNSGNYTFLAAGTVSMPTVFSGVTQSFDLIYINLIGINSSVFSDYTLPTSYTLSNFNVNFGISWSGGSFGGNNSVSGASVLTVTNVSQVPEPVSVALAGAGVAALTLIGRRRR